MLMAQVTGTTPHEIIINMGDTHIYENHIPQVQKQLTRKPCYFPKLRINKEIETLQDIEAMSFSDFELVDYHSHPGIKAEMAV